MRDKDYFILQWLAGYSEPIAIEETNAPHDVRVNFTFSGVDRSKYPDAIRVALFDLGKYGLVKERYNKFEITEHGRKELEMYLQKIKRKNEKENLQFESLQVELQKAKLEIDDLVNRLIDYDKVKRQSKMATIYAGVSALTAAIAILIALIKK
jgi:hypothetical protein